MVFLSPPNSNGLALSTFQARTNPPLTRALAGPNRFSAFPQFLPVILDCPNDMRLCVFALGLICLADSCGPEPPVWPHRFVVT